MRRASAITRDITFDATARRHEPKCKQCCPPLLGPLHLSILVSWLMEESAVVRCDTIAVRRGIIASVKCNACMALSIVLTYQRSMPQIRKG